MSNNEAIRVRKTIRPMRFLFLVPSEDLNVTKQVIRINTALWGGFYNPIIFVEQNKDDILSLFRASHSDAIVNFTSKPILNSSLGLENYQVIEKDGWDGLLQMENEKFQFRYGCDVRPLIRYHWREEGRFQTISKPESKQNKFFYIEGEDEHWANYSLLEFGQYPPDFLYDYKSNYQKVTNCTILQINASTLPETRHTIQLTPLVFTLAETEYFYYGASSRFHSEMMIYIGDLNNKVDWIEFWNLRCFYSRATFVHWEDTSLFETYIRNISEQQNS
jgi:hypothetical protein